MPLYKDLLHPSVEEERSWCSKELYTAPEINVGRLYNKAEVSGNKYNKTIQSKQN